MRIETATGSESEERTKRLLVELLENYDTSRWHFTDHVIIDENALGHSHPVLTLGTTFPVRSRIGVISLFLHEQIHWYLAGKPGACSAAQEELRRMYPEVPDASNGGARDECSTYLHLIVNWLEIEVLRAVVGTDDAEETLQAARYGRVYQWIYSRVAEDGEAIGNVIRKHGLGARLPPRS